MKIKLIHTGDIHIGREFKNFSNYINYGQMRRNDILDTFMNIINRAKEQNSNLLLIAGDFFDENTCNIGDLKLINDEFKKLKNIKILICAGNHDPIDDRSLYKLVNWAENVHIFSNCNAIEEKDFDDINTSIYSVSWKTKERQDNILKNIQIKDYSRINILMVHGDMTNSDSKYLPLNKDDLLRSGFDYIAMGHIHKHIAYYDNLCYCGSPEPLDFGETGEHGVVEVILSKQISNMKFIPLSKRRYHALEIKINPEMNQIDVLEAIKANMNTINRKEDIYKIKLTGIRDNSLKLDIDQFKTKISNLVQFVQIIDETKSDYDLDQLYLNNKHNIIGCFIKEMKTKDLNNPVVKEALYIGLELLLSEKVNI
ncbi:metallophosphoesterase family protein [Abyssisolibacter fermentans]|uniref:metallophosphoesterase family protein n=1 Tax=Abyssisolibacter fermentans TaxID=1766203 RepID=UPI0008339D2B|nr:DNA repair exonuclease [Abyssisolibacter fermentans]